ncbi:MAG: DUF2961 domain-containing protein [Clostridia bacterium]|nr:DUF2961 domain-containing protein [Clostridia bacterium]
MKIKIRSVARLFSLILSFVLLSSCANVTKTNQTSDDMTNSGDGSVQDSREENVQVSEDKSVHNSEEESASDSGNESDMTIIEKNNYTYTDIIYRMLDTRYLSYAGSDERSYEFTSYDRSSKLSGGQYRSWNANDDGSGYIEKTDDGGYLIAEMDGPGYISRIWSATASSGKVKIYIDGEETPRIDLSFADYFNCAKSPFIYKGLCYEDTARGKNSYLPITYNKSCRVVAYGDWGKYYHINYTTLPKGKSVESMPTEFSDEQKAALMQVNEFYLSEMGTNPSGTKDTAFEKYTISKDKSAQKVLTGKGAINGILIRLDLPDEKYALDTVNLLKSINLKIYWDGMSYASVNVPLGDFFGSAYGMTEVKTALLGVRDDGTFYNYFYMPYLEEAKIELNYSGEGSVDVMMALSTAKADHTQDNISYFCANFTNGSYNENRKPDHNFLTVQGEGRLVGLTLHVSKSTDEVDPNAGPGSHWWGEGDEKFFIDGEAFPSWFGTGTEDFFGYARCDSGLFNRAFHSQSYCFGGAYYKGNRSLTRLLVTDSIPFYESFDGYFEKYYSDEHVTYGYTAYYYLTPGSVVKGNEVETEKLLSYFTPDPGALITNFTEGEYLRYVGSNSPDISQAPQSLLNFHGEWSEDKHLFIKGLSVGKYAEYVLPAMTDGKYMLIASFTTAPDYAKIKVSVNGKELGNEIDCYTGAVLADYLYPIGEAELTAGLSNTVRFTVTGKNTLSSGYYFGVDFLLLIPASEYSGTENIDLSEYCKVSRLNAKKDERIEYRYEGESLITGSAVSGGYTSVQEMSGIGSKWSRSQQLWWRGGNKSSTLTLKILVSEAGDYDITGAFTQAIDYGIVDIYVNGQKIASDLDFCHNGVIHCTEDLGVVSLKSGYNELKIVITGKNQAATDYMVGIDYFSIKKAKS